jgi:hypothetical protein
MIVQRPARLAHVVLLVCALPCIGHVEDTRCNVEAVEFANSAQLSSILEELLNTTYFRLFKVRPQFSTGTLRRVTCLVTCHLPASPKTHPTKP